MTADDTTVLAAVAAHRTGQPLHHELVALGAEPIRCAWTAPVYRLLALPGTGVRRGGIVAAPEGGVPIEVELHRIRTSGLGALARSLPPPLELGLVQLEDETVLGIVCTAEPDGALDISPHGSWPAYLLTTG